MKKYLQVFLVSVIVFLAFSTQGYSQGMVGEVVPRQLKAHKTAEEYKTEGLQGQFSQLRSAANPQTAVSQESANSPSSQKIEQTKPSTGGNVLLKEKRKAADSSNSSPPNKKE